MLIDELEELLPLLDERDCVLLDDLDVFASGEELDVESLERELLLLLLLL